MIIVRPARRAKIDIDTAIDFLPTCSGMKLPWPNATRVPVMTQDIRPGILDAINDTVPAVSKNLRLSDLMPEPPAVTGYTCRRRAITKNGYPNTELILNQGEWTYPTPEEAKAAAEAFARTHKRKYEYCIQQETITTGGKVTSAATVPVWFTL